MRSGYFESMANRSPITGRSVFQGNAELRIGPLHLGCHLSGRDVVSFGYLLIGESLLTAGLIDGPCQPGILASSRLNSSMISDWKSFLESSSLLREFRLDCSFQ